MRRVNIVGAGLAGLSAAITLGSQGYACNLISIQNSERAQSVLAEGGINAALDTMGEKDTIMNHYEDTMRGGCDLADPAAVEGLTGGAPETVRWLADLGVPFHMENGKIILRNFGGQKKKRTVYAKSSTGKVIVSALIDEVRKYENVDLIRRYPHHEFIRLLMDEEKGTGICSGLRIKDMFSGRLYDCPGIVLLATGGMSGIFPEMTTGTVMNTGDVTATVFAQGVTLSNLEMIQYHPTTIGISGKRLLVTEAARGEGGRLCVKRNGQWWYFMEELYPELKNLMPRDVVAREMYRTVRREDCENQVYLDMTGLSRETWTHKLPDMRKELMDYLGMDPAKKRIPVEPGIHYFMGGIDVDCYHRTNLKNLYAAGECTSQYHGANRLGGNSMLGAVYGGKRAANHILKSVGWVDEIYQENLLQNENQTEGTVREVRKKPEVDWEENITEVPMERSDAIEELYEKKASPAFIKKESHVLLKGLGIVRSEEQLQDACRELSELKNDAGCIREKNRLLLGQAMLESALFRKESRGAHFREDYPNRVDAYQKMILASYKDGKVELE